MNALAGVAGWVALFYLTSMITVVIIAWWENDWA